MNSHCFTDINITYRKYINVFFFNYHIITFDNYNMIILLKKYFRRMNIKFPKKERCLSRKHTIYHMLARYIKSPDVIKYIYKMIIDREFNEESFYRQNMTIYHLLGGKYWPMYNIEMPSMKTLTSINIFREKLPMDKNMEWIIRNGRLLIPNHNTKKIVMQQIIMIGTPGLFVNYYGNDNEPYDIVNRKNIIKFLNSINDINHVMDYSYDDLYEDYEIYIETGIPISII